MLRSNVHDRTTAALDPCPRFLRSRHSPCICLDRPPVCNLVSWTSPRVCHLRPNDFVDGVVSSYSRGDFLCDRLCEVSRLAHSKSGGSCPSLQRESSCQTSRERISVGPAIRYEGVE